jgi:hypothetical protein
MPKMGQFGRSALKYIEDLGNLGVQGAKPPEALGICIIFFAQPTPFLGLNVLNPAFFRVNKFHPPTYSPTPHQSIYEHSLMNLQEKETARSDGKHWSVVKY